MLTATAARTHAVTVTDDGTPRWVRTNAHVLVETLGATEVVTMTCDDYLPLYEGWDPADVFRIAHEAQRLAMQEVLLETVNALG